MTTAAELDPPRCGHTWYEHTCWERPGHDGPHRCRIGYCAEQPTTTPQEPS